MEVALRKIGFPALSGLNQWEAKMQLLSHIKQMYISEKPFSFPID
ncbi:hypothetical protein NUH30_14030 [Leptospira sp. 85282-16]|nr:hypothetical protein [Leptospira sp. 85282-16]MCT8334799.1 hypothetical protein [Leptospira sp. 85282-16]